MHCKTGGEDYLFFSRISRCFLHVYKACQGGEGNFLIIQVGSSFCYKWVLILNGVSMLKRHVCS